MIPESRFEATTNQLPEVAREAARYISEAAGESSRTAMSEVRNVNGAIQDATTNAFDAAKNATSRATDTVKHLYQSAASQTHDALATSKDYTTRHPARVVIGAFVLGAAISYILTAGRRGPTSKHHIAEEPLFALRDSILTAIAPLAKQVHGGYALAKDSAEKVADRVHHMAPRHNRHSRTNPIGRIGNKLKFW